MDGKRLETAVHIPFDINRKGLSNQNQKNIYSPRESLAKSFLPKRTWFLTVRKEADI